MKIRGLLLFAAALVATNAYAAEPVYLDLGQASGEAQAKAHIASIKKMAPELAKISYQTIPVQNGVRMQAGPLMSKEAGFSACAKVLQKKSECYVVQPQATTLQLSQLPRQSVASNNSQVTPSLPQDSQPQPNVVPRDIALPWLQPSENPVKSVLDAPPPLDTNPPQPRQDIESAASSGVAPWQQKLPNFQGTPSREETIPEGKVDVAEAVRVPLSSAPVPAAPISVQQAPVPTAPVSLRIGNFAGETQALEFWRNVSQAMPQALETVRAQVSQPFIRNGNSGVVLTLEPLSGQAMQDVCSYAAQAGVRCLASPRPRAMLMRGPRFAGYRLIDASNRSRADVLSMDMPDLLNLQKRAAAKAGRKLSSYWVQLGSASSRSQAQQQWSELRMLFPRLLARHDAVITTPLRNSSSQDIYRLRTGPFPLETAANDLCGHLSAKAVDCLVVRDF